MMAAPCLVLGSEAEAARAVGDAAYWVLGAYLLLLLGLGLAGYARRRAGEEDYYLASRSQGWLVSSLTIMATFFSSFALLGAPGMVYKDGVVFALFALNVPVGGAAIYVLGSRISRLGRARGYVTPGDMISDYYQSPHALRLLAALIGFLYAVPYVVMQIKAGGFLCQRMFPGERSFEIGAAVLAGVTMLYIMIGGMRSVAWTDVIQGFLLVSGMLTVGAATVVSMGGVGAFFEKVGQLPASSLTFPGNTGSWSPERLFTVCAFASLGSMIQPAQWMRYYSADSTRTLRRGALIFTVVLTACFLFGVMLVGLGGQVEFPLTDARGAFVYDEAGKQLPHPAVGATHNDHDQILIAMVQTKLPEVLGAIGAAAAALMLVAIMAASMSTADSNLHALSAVFTRDIYDRYVRRRATDAERTWVGRGAIALATVLALTLVIVYRDEAGGFNPLQMIASLGLLAIAFSSQLLPVTLDMLFVRRGTRVGAICGIIAGLVVVVILSPFGPALFSDESTLDLLATMKRMIDVGSWGLAVNAVVFVLLSCGTQPPDSAHVQRMVRWMGDR